MNDPLHPARGLLNESAFFTRKLRQLAGSISLPRKRDKHILEVLDALTRIQNILDQMDEIHKRWHSSDCKSSRGMGKSTAEKNPISEN